jgi:hypothetical protein
MNTVGSYFRNLQDAVIRHSESNVWHSAVREWIIEDVEEDETLTESCVCGKERLHYLFTIRNVLNGNELYPIGSTCIKRFERSDLNEEVNMKVQLFELLHAIERNEFIVLSSDFFSRKLLRYLYVLGAFKGSEYNDFEPFEDYQFMLDMFNKRMRTKRQDKKASAIIINSIRPFLRKMLSSKIR